jgi:acyl carrier protein
MDHLADKADSTATILARVQDIFRAELDDEDLVIDMNTRQADLKGWDSLAHIRLVSGIESEFDCQFSLTDIEQTNSVRQFVDLIRQHQP